MHVGISSDFGRSFRSARFWLMRVSSRSTGALRTLFSRRGLNSAAGASPLTNASLCRLDLDHSKAVNDDFGNDEDDRVIALLARCAQANLPANAVLAGRRRILCAFAAVGCGGCAIKRRDAASGVSSRNICAGSQSTTYGGHWLCRDRGGANEPASVDGARRSGAVPRQA